MQVASRDISVGDSHALRQVGAAHGYFLRDVSFL